MKGISENVFSIQEASRPLLIDQMMKRAVLGNAAQNEMLRNVGNPSPRDAPQNFDRRHTMSVS
jgi:hypothetical protein